MYGYGFGWNGLGWGGMFFGGLMMLLFWGALIVLAFFALRALLHSNQERSGSRVAQVGSQPGSPLEILRERYARGEITRAEYEELRHDLAA